MKMNYESPQIEVVKMSLGEVLLMSPDEKPTSGGTIVDPPSLDDFT